MDWRKRLEDLQEDPYNDTLLDDITMEVEDAIDTLKEQNEFLKQQVKMLMEDRKDKRKF